MKTGTLALALIFSQVPTTAMAAGPVGNASDGLQVLRELNLFVTGDVFSQTEVEGKSYIGGTLSGGSSNYGVGSTNGQAATASTRATLTVGGNVTGGTININSGPGLAVGGNVSSVDFKVDGITARIGGTLGGTHTRDGADNLVEVGGSASNVEIRGGDRLNVLGSLNNVSASTGSVIRVGGTITGNKNYNGATHSESLGGGFTTVPQTASYAATTAQATADLTALSVKLGAFTADSTIDASNHNNVKFASTGGSDHVAVFSITNAASFFAAAKAFSFNVGSATSVIINVSNATFLSSLTIDQNFLGSANGYSQKLIWNIDPSIGMLNLTTQFNGSLLAIRSSLRNSNFIQGAVAVANLDQHGEVHLGTYDGMDVSAVPEPAIWLELVAGFGMTGALVRRRRAEAVSA